MITVELAFFYVKSVICNTDMPLRLFYTQVFYLGMDGVLLNLNMFFFLISKVELWVLNNIYTNYSLIYYFKYF